jgi:amidohydrolase
MALRAYEIAKDTVSSLTQTRRELHAQPELSGEESSTASKISAYLERLQPSMLLRDVGGHGVVAVFDFEKDGPSVMVRAEMDALPINEKNTFDHRSQIARVSHKCGHDGHMTILLGLADTLSEDPLECGRVILLFQPSEENGAGAQNVLDDDRIEQFAPHFAFALHNLPGYPMGSIVLREDIFTASVQSLIIKLTGAVAHAAQPELGNNPALAIAAILQHADGLSRNDPLREDFALITPVYVHMGKKAYGISAGRGEVHFTMRTWTADRMDGLAGKFVEKVRDTASDYQLEVDLAWTNVFYANRNDPAAVAYIAQAAAELDYDVIMKEAPFKWGEDFGIFTQKYRGAMFGLGSGEDAPPLHHAEYDFPDELIPIGVQMLRNIVNRILR